MSKAARSLFVFGLYLVVLGLLLLIAPNPLITFFGLPAVTDVWIRVAGMLILLLAYYNIQASIQENEGYFRMTIGARMSVIVFFAVFVLLDFVKPILLLFGVVDFLAALWTMLTLRRAK